MPKNVLGRGLGELLPEHRSVSKESNGQHRAGDPADLGRGLRALVLKKNGTIAGSGLSPLGPQAGRSPLVIVSLVLADILLVLTTVFWRTHAKSPMTGSQATVCIVAILFAAWLSVLAVWLCLQRR